MPRRSSWVRRVLKIVSGFWGCYVDSETKGTIRFLVNHLLMIVAFTLFFRVADSLVQHFVQDVFYRNFFLRVDHWALAFVYCCIVVRAVVSLLWRLWR